jgi:hypothetical protein
MCRVAVFAQIVVLLPQLQGNQLELLIYCEIIDKSLDGVSALLVFDEVCQLWSDSLQYL